MTPKQIRQLRSLLLECATMQQRARRDAVVADLPKEIRANIERDDADAYDVANILKTCLLYPDGLEELIDSLHSFERNSLAMQAVLQFQTELVNHQPIPAPKPEPIPPAPKPQPDSIPDNPVSKSEPTLPAPTPQPTPIPIIDPTPKPPATTQAFTLTSPNELIWAKDGKVMVHVPAGEFLYGDDKQKMELPEFWIDKTSVTNAEYARFVVETDRKPPSHWKAKTPPTNISTHPVVWVNWHDAVAYAEWAGKQLPPEEFWEKAAGRKYTWGDNESTDKLSNFKKGLGKILSPFVATTYYTTSVGQYSPQGDSPYGCVDMAGNVREWTANLSASPYGYKILRDNVLIGSSYLPVVVRISNDSNANLSNWGFRCFFVPIY